MFTGIIKHVGLFRGFGHGRKEIIIEAAALAPRIKVGESIAVNGVCLTLIRKQANLLFFSLSEETLQKTTLGSLRSREKVNLELPLTLSTPLGGHLVSGHVDSRGKVQKIIKKKNGLRLAVSFPPHLRPYFIPKGSVALNGVSLTIAELGPSWLEAELIPVTLAESNLGDLKRGQEVNIECDMIGKYVYNWISKQNTHR
ncbi:MAG: riboflavin synthase [Candidatus Aminicenantes bacterium]